MLHVGHAESCARGTAIGGVWGRGLVVDAGPPALIVQAHALQIGVQPLVDVLVGVILIMLLVTALRQLRQRVAIVCMIACGRRLSSQACACLFPAHDILRGTSRTCIMAMSWLACLLARLACLLTRQTQV